MKLFARIYAIATDGMEAQEILARLLHAFAAQGPSPAASPEQYWKIREYYGFTLEFARNTEAAFEEILAMTEAGWRRISRFDAVWNASLEHVFVMPEVRWAQLELFRPTP